MLPRLTRSAFHRSGTRTTTAALSSAKWQRIAATQRSNAQLLAGHQQPAFPCATVPGYHDSLQYHFFLPGLFVAVRVWMTASLQHHSAWLYDFATPEAGAVELHSSRTPLSSLDSPSGALCLEAPEMSIEDDASAGLTLTFRPMHAAARRALSAGGVGDQLIIRASQQHAYGWMPAGFEGENDRPVIHRPDLEARADWRGQHVRGCGYSKRYHGIYPRYNGWRFIHGLASGAAPGGATPHSHLYADHDPKAVVWTADATFGDDKYNYYKLMPSMAFGDSSPEAGELVEAAVQDTYQQADAGYAIIDDERHSAQLQEITKWHAIIGGQAPGEMEGKLENRLCLLTLYCGDSKAPLHGLAYNERYFGTLW